MAEHHCDSSGRRVRAIITLHAPQGVTDTAFLYDGWNLVVEYNLAAACRYDAYDLLVSATGPEKDRFRHRFSNKVHDKERGLLHDGCRSLGTTTGRWINRDPIEEEGG